MHVCLYLFFHNMWCKHHFRYCTVHVYFQSVNACSLIGCAICVFTAGLHVVCVHDMCTLVCVHLFAPLRAHARVCLQFYMSKVYMIT